jgi:hypothetical protein
MQAFFDASMSLGVKWMGWISWLSSSLCDGAEAAAALCPGDYWQPASPARMVVAMATAMACVDVADMESPGVMECRTQA